MNTDETMQQKRLKDLEYWKQRSLLPNEAFLNEYADAKRKEALAQVQMVQEAINSEESIMNYIKEHGTDEG